MCLFSMLQILNIRKFIEIRRGEKVMAEKILSEKEKQYYLECLDMAMDLVKHSKCKGSSLGQDGLIAATVFLKIAKPLNELEKTEH